MRLANRQGISSIQKLACSWESLCLLGTLFLLNSCPVNAAASASLDWKLQEVEGERRLETQDYETAESCFRAALKAVRKDRAASKDEVVSCMESLAAVLQLENQTQDVIPLYKKSARLLEQAHGKDSARVVPTLIVLAGVFELEGDYKVAAQYYSRALAITQKDPGQTSFAFADCEHRLGRATAESGLPRQAAELYLSALSHLMQQMELPSSKVLDELLSDYIDLSRKDPAPEKILSSDFQKELLKDQLGLLERTKGIGTSMWNKEVNGNVAVPISQGRINASGSSDNTSPPFQSKNQRSAQLPAIMPDNSLPDSVAMDQINKQRIEFYERMIATDIDSLGPEHPSVGRDLSGLASVYLLQKKYSEAKPLLMRALKIYNSVYGTDALLARRTQALLDLIAEEQLPPENERFSANDFEKDLPRIPLAAQKLEIALKLNYLAFLNYCHGNLNTAAKIYAWALADSALSTGEQNMLVASCLTDYSRVLRSTGKQDVAAKFETSAHSILRKVLTHQAALSLP